MAIRKNIAINNFSAGEWSAFLDARADLQKYESACIRMENFRPLPWGGATLRSGTEYFGQAKYGNIPSRLIPFNYSTSLSYVLELGNGYVRFWYSNGSQVTVSPNTAPAAAWVSGANYLPGAFSTSLVNRETYYSAGGVNGSAVDPANDAVHWVQQSAYEQPAPWATAQLFAVQTRQINAQMRMVHNQVAPQTLTYSGATAWAMAPTAFKYPVLMDQNAVQSLQMAVGSIAAGASTTLSATSPAWGMGTYYPIWWTVLQGGVLYQCQASHTSGVFNTDLAAGKWAVYTLFTPQHVGSYWELQQLAPSSSLLMNLNDQTVGVWSYTSPIEVQGDWTFTTSQFWWGEVQVQRSVDNGQTWTVVRDFQAESDQNYETDGTEQPPNIGYPAVLYRIAYNQAGGPFDASIWSGSPPTQYSFGQASLVAEDAYIAGLVLVTGYTSNTQVTVTIVLPPVSTADTYLWSEGAFSNYRGFPGTISFYEQRLLYCGTAFQPNNIWGSVTGDFDNFQYSSDDDGAVSFQPAVCQQNQAQWLATLLRIHIGTSGEEIIMASGDLDEALTPSNVTCRAQSNYGSSQLQPLLLQNSILFVERNGRRVREMRELSPYVVPTDFVAPDLTLLAEHITQPLSPTAGLVLPGGGITCMDFGRLPDPLCYFVRSDGQMPVMTYNREQSIIAWARYVTTGNFESVACIYGEPADEVFVSVARVLNGQTVRCIEGLTIDASEYPSQEFDLLLDCGYQSPFSPEGYTSVSVPWLANMSVTAVLDGAEYAGLTVGTNGVLNLPTTGYLVNVGLPYTGYLSIMKPVMSYQEGSSQGKKVRVAETIVRVRNSLTIEYAGGENPADSSSNWRLKKYRSPGDISGSITPLTSTNQDGSANPNGVADLVLDGPWPDGNNFSGQVNFRQSHPFPTTLLGVFTKFDVMD